MNGVDVTLFVAGVFTIEEVLFGLESNESSLAGDERRNSCDIVT